MSVLSGLLSIESILIGILFVFAVAITAFYFKRKSEQIKKIRAELARFEQDILDADKEFRIENNKNLYFSKKTLYLWKEKWRHIESILKRFNKMRHNRQMQVAGKAELLDSIRNVYRIFLIGSDLVKERNNAFACMPMRINPTPRAV